MVSKSHKDRGNVPLPHGRTSWLINGGDPNHLLSGMILQITVDFFFEGCVREARAKDCNDTALFLIVTERGSI